MKLRQVLLATPIALSACCSNGSYQTDPPGPEPIRPTLPAGRPPDRAEELAEMVDGWSYPEQWAGEIRAPAREVFEVLRELQRWRVWAETLEAAVQWQEPPAPAEPSTPDPPAQAPRPPRGPETEPVRD